MDDCSPAGDDLVASYGSWSYDFFIDRTFFLSLGLMIPDDVLFSSKRMFYYHFSSILRVVQLDFFLDVLSREGMEWKSYSSMIPGSLVHT